MAQYATAVGFVQFEPVWRDANGKDVVDYTIRTPGSDGSLVRVTVWPELQGDDIQKGDFIAADGKLTVGSYEKDGETRKSIQINAYSLAVIKGRKPEEREVVNRESSQDDDEPLF